MWLEQGEPIPARCGKCGHWYQFEGRRVASMCPNCGYITLEEETDLR